MSSNFTNYFTLKTLNIVFSVTYYLDLHNAIPLIISAIFNVQTTNLTFVGKT